MRIKIYTDISKQHLMNTIIADEGFAQTQYPDRWEIDQEPAPVESADVTKWFIDVGPFMDRFGASKIQILASPDAVVRAVTQDMMARKWIDLQRADVGQAIDLMISKGFALDKSAILTTPVTPEENLALRKLYFQ